MTVNIKQAPFYPGLIPDEEQNKIRNSDLWPIVLALHFNTGGKIFVSDLAELAGSGGCKLHFRTSNGAHILGLKKQGDGTISIHLSADVLHRVLYKNDLIFSGDSKYIVNKLKDGEGALERIKNHMYQNESRMIPDSLSRLTTGFSRQIKEAGTEITVELGREAQEYALRALFNGTNLEINQNHITTLQEWYKKIQESDAKKERYQKKYSEMFSPWKHLVIHIRPDLFIVGQVRTISREKDYKISCNVIQELIMTKDINTQPELMASLTFWKVLRESRKEKVGTLDSQGMLVSMAEFVDLEASSMAMGLVGQGSNDTHAIYLIHKTGEEV